MGNAHRIPGQHTCREGTPEGETVRELREYLQGVREKNRPQHGTWEKPVTGYNPINVGIIRELKIARINMLWALKSKVRSMLEQMGTTGKQMKISREKKEG